jgi:hypothetical protein
MKRTSQQNELPPASEAIVSLDPRADENLLRQSTGA